MSNHISEEGPRQGHAAGDTSVEQQASQLASDIKYKARQKMKQTSGSSLSPAQVQALYRQLLNASPAPGAVKSIVKKKLFEKVDRGVELVSETIKGSKSSVFGKIFVEGGGQKEEVIEEDADQKFVIRVTDKATGNTSYRKADRAKIAQLRANPNISSVEITGRKKADDAYDSEKTGGKKAKKDYDGDGKIESGTAEYMGSRDKAIKKAMAKEEVIYEGDKEEKKEIDVMKGKNKIVINPPVNEEQSGKPSPEEKKQLEAKKRMLQKKMMLQKQAMQMQKQGRLPLNYNEESEQVRYCPKCDKDETRDECQYGGEYWDENSKPSKAEDSRGTYAMMNMIKNKLRVRGLKMSFEPDGNQINEEDADRLRDRRQERGGVAGNQRYDRAPKAPNTKKFGTGKTMAQKEMEKKYGKGASAMDVVRAQIRAKHGKDALK